MFGHSFELLGAKGGGQPSDPFVAYTTLNTFGGCGVIIFFAISGYWITRSAETATTWIDFAWRRAVRILPGLWVMLVLTVIVLGPLETSLSLPNYFYAHQTREYLQGFFLVLRDGLPGVFQNNPLTSTVNGSLWTLRIEVKCYLLISLIVITPKRARGFLVAVLAVITLYLALRHVFWRPFNVPFFRENSSVSVYALSAFFLGAVVCRCNWEGRCSIRIWVSVLALVMLAGYLFPGRKPLALAFAISLSMATLSVGLNWSSALVGKFFKGDISYGLYLYAFPIQQAILAHNRFIDPGILFVCTLLFLIPIAIASWVFVEKPMLSERHLGAQFKTIKLKSWRTSLESH